MNFDVDMFIKDFRMGFCYVDFPINALWDMQKDICELEPGKKVV